MKPAARLGSPLRFCRMASLRLDHPSPSINQPAVWAPSLTRQKPPACDHMHVDRLGYLHRVSCDIFVGWLGPWVPLEAMGPSHGGQTTRLPQALQGASGS
ncbi:unnamed protein product [Arctogadus glacialis]